MPRWKPHLMRSVSRSSWSSRAPRAPRVDRAVTVVAVGILQRRGNLFARTYWHADFVLRCHAVTTPLRHVGACKHGHRNGAADRYLDVRARLRAEPMGFGAKPFSARRPAGRCLGTAPRVTGFNRATARQRRAEPASSDWKDRGEGAMARAFRASAGSRASPTRVRLRFGAGWCGTRSRALQARPS